MSSTKATARPVYRAPRSLGGRTGAEVGDHRRAGGSKRLRRRRDLVGYVFSGPALVILAIFVFYPTFYALVMSFTNATGFNSPSFIGLDNYERAFTNPDSLSAIWHTVVYAVVYAPVVIIVALALAVLLNQVGMFLRSALRTTIFVPFIISMAVAALAYGFILNAQTGILPYWVSRLGVTLPDILNSSTWALPAVGIIGTWFAIGLCTVLLMAGIGKIDGSIYEAARLDGAGFFRTLRAVTIPGLRQEIGVCVTITIIAALASFDIIFLSTQGGPGTSTMVPGVQVYELGFTQSRIGLASALAIVLSALVLVVILPLQRFFRER